MSCQLCNKPYPIFASKYFRVFRDKYPVTRGHLLAVSKQCVANYWELSPSALKELDEVLVEAKELLESKDPSITGFNIGMNCGKSAGQTVMHFHCHLIPRRDGDTPDPTGGVRGVIPSKQNYTLT